MSRGMRAWGRPLKIVALIGGWLAAAALAEALDNGDAGNWGLAAGFGIGSLLVAALGYRMAGPQRKVLVRPVHTGSLDFAPRDGEGWRPAEDWRLFPDPVPHAPIPLAWANPAPPDGEVPPDEVLRRLWLVRAHLMTYLATFRYAFNGRDALLPVPAVLAEVVFIGYGVSALGSDEDNARISLFCAVVTLWPLVRSCTPMVRGMIVSYRRYFGLHREQKRLAALDGQHPGGPLGGPDVRDMRGAYGRERGRYVPPEVPAGSLPR